MTLVNWKKQEFAKGYNMVSGIFLVKLSGFKVLTGLQLKMAV